MILKYKNMCVYIHIIYIIHIHMHIHTYTYLLSIHELTKSDFVHNLESIKKEEE